MKNLARLVELAIVATLTFGAATAYAADATLSPEGVHALIAGGQAKDKLVLLDVRSPAEFADGHLPGAINLNVNDGSFAAKIQQLDKSKKYIVYCRTQNRSARAADQMRRADFTDVTVMEDGFSYWQRKGFPVEKP
jgi:rhodanese-related sulfurtransferase